MKVGITEAKNRFADLVARAQAGEEIVITKRGKPRAKLVAIGEQPQARKPR